MDSASTASFPTIEPNVFRIDDKTISDDIVARNLIVDKVARIWPFPIDIFELFLSLCNDKVLNAANLIDPNETNIPPKYVKTDEVCFCPSLYTIYPTADNKHPNP